MTGEVTKEVKEEPGEVSKEVKEKPIKKGNYPASASFNVKAFQVAGPMHDQYYRLAGMTDEERAFRRQYLKDQILHESEPRPVEGYYQARYNPIRRFYMWPLNTLFKPIVPIMGYNKAAGMRWWTGKIALVYTLAVLATYNLMYQPNDWTRQHGWRFAQSREQVFPGDPKYPAVNIRTKPADYYNNGFDKCPL